jgi:CheY-like chemotaxis protein
LPLILIIDDDVILLASLGIMLEDAGFSVAKSSDLINAERIYATDHPDLVLLEVRSERERGWDLLPQLAAATPVIVLSAASREDDVVRGFAAGAADYIAKPYRSAELLARVRARLAIPAPVPVAAFAAAPVEATAPPKVGTAERLAAPPPPPPPPPTARRASGRREGEEEPVFMSDAEEMALLRMPDPRPATAAASTIAALDESASIGPRLRGERLRRHLTLVQVENELKIRMSYLQALEDEKYTLLPRGPVALQMVRSYVTFLGIDPEPVVEEFRTKHYVEQYDPLPALGGSRIPRSLPTWLIWVVAVLLALAVAVGVILYFDPSFFQNLWAQIMRLLARTPLGRLASRPYGVRKRSRAASASLRIWVTRASIPENFCSPRRRCRNSSRSSLPYRSPLQSSRWASTVRRRPSKVGRRPTFVTAGRLTPSR